MSPSDHPQIPPRRVGVLLVNLGTPDAPTPGAVRRYLGEFLSDRRVVEIPPLVWQPILRGIILNTRPRKSAHAYSQVWREDGSPLAAITRAQAAALDFGEGVMVDWAMRYGGPAIGDRLAAMKDAGCERILIAPLYPQYCAATTATANDEAFRALAAMRWQPAIRTLPPYHDDPLYIGALKDSIEASLAALDFAPEAIVASFHGMPARTLELGEAVYWSRSRKTLWHKGATSGLVQKVVEVRVDDDQDAIWLRVEVRGGASCHVGYRSCFYRRVPVGDDAAKGDFKLVFTETEKVFDPQEHVFIYSRAALATLLETAEFEVLENHAAWRRAHEIVVARRAERPSRAVRHLANLPQMFSWEWIDFIDTLNAFGAPHGLRQFTNWSKLWEYPWLWHHGLSSIDWRGKRKTCTFPTASIRPATSVPGSSC